ncbi:SRPBCC family protein [Flindersiella endophytica]
MTSDTFRLRAFLAASPERVFHALTDPNGLRSWLAEHAEVSLPDKQFSFWGRYTPNGDAGRQRLLDAEPGRLLRFAWDLDSTERIVEIGLAPDDHSGDGPAGTVLTLTQTGSTTYDQMVEGIQSEASLWDWRLPIANLANYLEGRAPAPRLDFTEQPPGDSVRIDVPIDAPAEQVFAALIEPDKLDRWFGNDSFVEPRVGGEIRFSPQEQPVKIFELEPNRSLAYSWRWQGKQTAVRWELDGSGGQTQLTIVHSGFGDDQPGARQHLGGWLCFLAELRRMLEVGAAWRPIEIRIPGMPDDHIAHAYAD